ncbi:L1 55 kDa protein [Human adenovirus 7]|uniref:L1 55 kDa protein n=1 Tax=Human adenovirus B serotype 7 TaxID=10519 RepID=A0A219PC41_ADE07|nr:L1 55 kDa protein [Human adenovirus 7]
MPRCIPCCDRCAPSNSPLLSSSYNDSHKRLSLQPVTTAAAAVSGAGQPAYDLELEEGEGLARLGAPSPERHPRVQLKKDSSEAYVPQQNLFRDRSGEEPEEMRASRFNAGRELRHGLDRRRVLQDEDFEVDEVTGISPARAHVAAAT